MAKERTALPDLSLTRLRVFAAVVEQGGYSAAAHHLALSQPTVSFHVQALERAYGTRLLVYRARRVRATAAGQALYRLAVRTLRGVEELAEQIADLRAGRAGRVRLGASIAFEQAFFFDTVLAPFARGHPGVELQVRFGRSLPTVEALRAQETDLAYVARWHVPADLHYTPLHGSRVVFFVAEGHPLARHPDPTMEALGEAGIIAARLDSTEWQYYDLVLRSVGLRHYRITLEVDGIQARILAAQAGLGVLATFWPPYAREAALPRLRSVRLDHAPPGPEFGLLTREAELDTTAAGVFAEWLQQVARSPLS